MYVIFDKSAPRLSVWKDGFTFSPLAGGIVFVPLSSVCFAFGEAFLARVISLYIRRRVFLFFFSSLTLYT